MLRSMVTANTTTLVTLAVVAAGLLAIVLRIAFRGKR